MLFTIRSVPARNSLALHIMFISGSPSITPLLELPRKPGMAWVGYTEKRGADETEVEGKVEGKVDAEKRWRRSGETLKGISPMWRESGSVSEAKYSATGDLYNCSELGVGETSAPKPWGTSRKLIRLP